MDATDHGEAHGIDLTSLKHTYNLNAILGASWCPSVNPKCSISKEICANVKHHKNDSKEHVTKTALILIPQHFSQCILEL